MSLNTMTIVLFLLYVFSIVEGTWTEGEDGGLVVFGRRVEQLSDEAVRVHGVVVNELSQRVELALRRHVYLRQHNDIMCIIFNPKIRRTVESGLSEVIRI
jgi:hypothetical protein